MDRKREFNFTETLLRLMEKHPVTGKRTAQKELADGLGVRQQTVSEYRRGVTFPGAKTLLSMAEFFGVSTDYLLTGEEGSEVYTKMMTAYKNAAQEKLEKIAVLCSNAENMALGMMESGGGTHVQEQ
jgi:transcriptional regulator with XRE-family HTH domain